MTNLDPWYDIASPDAELTQGDLILNCPILTWDGQRAATSQTLEDETQLKQQIVAFRADIVVMTQACDLEHK